MLGVSARCRHSNLEFLSWGQRQADIRAHKHAILLENVCSQSRRNETPVPSADRLTVGSTSGPHEAAKSSRESGGLGPLAGDRSVWEICFGRQPKSERRVEHPFALRSARLVVSGFGRAIRHRFLLPKSGQLGPACMTLLRHSWAAQREGAKVPSRPKLVARRILTR